MVFFENFLETDLAQITEQEINETFCLINHRPRKMPRVKNFMGHLHPHEVVSPFGRESNYFMKNGRICMDNSSYKKMDELPHWIEKTKKLNIREMIRFD